MRIKMKKYKQDIMNIFGIILGTIVMSFAFNVFLQPNNISPSGFSGLSSVLCFLLAKIGIVIPVSVMYLLLNVILYVIAYKLLGKKFALMALIGIGSYSLFIELVSYIPLVVRNDLLLCAIYGGGIMGFGVGLVLRCNGSTGGGDLLALIIRSKTHILTTGQIMLSVNILVLTLSCLAYGLGPLMYSIITIVISSTVTDLVIEGATGVRAYYIFTSKKQEVCDAIYKEIKRGVTEIKAEGMYTHTEKDILLCLINKYRAPRLKSIVSKIDSDAFVFCTSVSEVIGRGFSIPPKKKHKGDAEALEKSQNEISPNNKENKSIENNQIENNQIKNTSTAVTTNDNAEASSTQAEALEDTNIDNKPTQEKTTPKKKAKTSSKRTKQKEATKEVK